MIAGRTLSALPLAAVLLLGGCETGPARQSGCTRDFATGDADKLRVDGYGPATVRIGNESPCVWRGKAASHYAVLALPEFEAPYYVEVVSRTAGQRLFPPLLATLDASGKVTRSLRSERLIYRGSNLVGTFFFNAENRNDRFLAVFPDAALTGSRVAQRVQGTDNTSFLIGSWYGGKDQSVDVQFVDHGQVEIRARSDPGSTAR